MDRMLVRTITWLPVIAAFVGCSASGDNNPLDARGSGASGGNGDSGLGSGSFVFPEASAPFTAAGSFPITSTDVAASACTIYRPTTLGEQGRKHPVIVWGNGTFNTPSSYDALLKHFASHGFIIAAADTSNSGSGTEMIACLEYILKQNTSSGDFQGKVDVDHIAVAGYSQGGAGTLMAGRDPRFLVTCTVSPYVVLPLGGYDSASLKAQVHPMFMISGSADTVAVPSDNQQPIYDGAPVPIVWGTFAGASHGEVAGAGGNYAGPMTAWFRFTLMNDQTAGAYFKKAKGGLAEAAGWTVQYNSKWTL